MWDGGAGGGPQLGTRLTLEEQHELRELLRHHKDTLTKLPSCTHLTEHTIEAGDSSPIHLQPHRLHHAYRETVKRELEEMELHNIIQPANSGWAAPIVIVQKKDGTIHLCVDYRRLNHRLNRACSFSRTHIPSSIDLNVATRMLIHSLDFPDNLF